MTGWMVSIEWDTAEPLTEEQLTAVAEIGGVAGGMYGGRRLGSTVTIDASDAAAAVAKLEERIADLVPGEVASISAHTIREADRLLDQPPFPELVGIAEVASLLDITRQRASALQTRADFPAPVQVLASGPVWRRDDLTNFELTWDRKSGRPVTWERLVSKRRADVDAILAKRLPGHPDFAVVGIEVKAGPLIEDRVRPYHQIHAMALAIGLVDPPVLTENGAVRWIRPPAGPVADDGLARLVSGRYP